MADPSENDKNCRLVPPLFPRRLPPETLFQVFRYLCYDVLKSSSDESALSDESSSDETSFSDESSIPEDSFHSEDLPSDEFLDLMSASMVCNDWYGPARSLICQDTLKSPFPWLYRRYGANLSRFAALLSTSRALGLSYATEITYADINLIILLHSNFATSIPTDQNPLFVVLSQLTCLTDLCLTLDNPAICAPKVRASFLTKLTEHFASAGISALELGEYEFSEYLNDPLHESLLKVLQPTLSTVKLMSSIPNTLVCAALARCPRLRDVRIIENRITVANTILRGSEVLCRVHLSFISGITTTVTTLIRDLTNRCAQLEELVIRGYIFSVKMPTKAALIFALALEQLVACCPSLRKLDVPWASNGVVRTLGRRCPNLKSLNVSRLIKVESDEGEGAVMWPRLKYVFIGNNQYYPDYMRAVKTVVQMFLTSEALTKIVLPWMSVQILEVELRQRGFVIGEIAGGFVTWRVEVKNA